MADWRIPADADYAYKDIESEGRRPYNEYLAWARMMGEENPATYLEFWNDYNNKSRQVGRWKQQRAKDTGQPFDWHKLPENQRPAHQIVGPTQPKPPWQVEPENWVGGTGYAWNAEKNGWDTWSRGTQTRNEGFMPWDEAPQEWRDYADEWNLKSTSNAVMNDRPDLPGRPTQEMTDLYNKYHPGHGGVSSGEVWTWYQNFQTQAVMPHMPPRPEGITAETQAVMPHMPPRPEGITAETQAVMPPMPLRPGGITAWPQGKAALSKPRTWRPPQNVAPPLVNPPNLPQSTIPTPTVKYPEPGRPRYTNPYAWRRKRAVGW